MLWNYDVSDKEEAERMASLYGEDFTRAVEPGMEVETGRNLVRRCGNELGVATWEAYDFDPDTWTCETFSNREAAELWLSGSFTWTSVMSWNMPVLLGALAVATEQNQRAIGRLLADRKFEDMPELPDAINPMEAAFAEAKGKLLEWKEGGHGDGMYYHDTASSYLDDYHELADEIGRPLLRDIDELIEYGYLDESGVYENPVAVIGTMLAEAALEHARADAEYFDEDFRMRATEGIDMWTVAREIAKTVPEAKPAEEEPTQVRGPKL